jgi:chromosome segregation ATPase
MNDTIVELEGQKALLLDEITGLRLQLDRENKNKGEMKARIQELTAATLEAGDYKLVSMEQRATAAEDNASKLQENLNELQDELRSVTANYKSDVARLEERLASRDSQLAEMKEAIEHKKKELVEAQEKVDMAHDDSKELKREIEKKEKECADKEHEIASMVSQRIAYEKRATRNIMDHVAEVDDLRAHCESLEEEVEYLKNRLHLEMGTPTRPSSAKSTPNVFRFDRAPPPPPPTSTPPRKWAQSPQGKWAQPQYSPHNTGIEEPPRTPVRGMVEKFERISAGSSTRESVPTDCRSSSPSPQIIQDESDISMSSGEAEAFDRKAASESEEVRQLQEQLQKQSELVGELRAEIATLTATRGAQAILVEKEHAHKSRDDQEQIESLEKELADTKCKLESETELVKALREELNILTFEKIAHQEEKDSNVEGQRAQRVEMNKLANAVTAAQMETANVERESKARIKELEDAIETINAEIDEELAAKQGEIDALQARLDQQIENVKRMEREREQICTNINTISNSKKKEIDELHEELMQQTATAASQAREIDSLTVQVEKQKDATEELEYLRFKVRDLEKKSSTGMSRPELDKLMADNHKLNESLRKMGMERRALQEKLTAVMSEKTSSKSVQVLRDRNSALKKEVERLSRRVRHSEKQQASGRIEI